MWKEKHVSTEPESLFSESCSLSPAFKSMYYGHECNCFSSQQHSKVKIPNTSLVMGKIPDDIEYVVHMHGTALAELV